MLECVASTGSANEFRALIEPVEMSGARLGKWSRFDRPSERVL